jgi:tetratricopeptide (TPR) repeat protein
VNKSSSRTTAGQKAALIFLGLFLTEIIFQIIGLVVAHPAAPKVDLVGDSKSIRILTVGESTTEWGGGHSYPSRLQVRLAEVFKDQKITVYNEGHSGSNTAEILQRIPVWMQKYRPHMVITLMGVNDPWGIHISESPILSMLDKVKIFKLVHYAWINIQAARQSGEIKKVVRKDHWDSGKYPDPTVERPNPDVESFEILKQFQQAQFFFEAKNYQRSADIFHKTMKKAERRYPYYLFNLGVAEYHLGNIKEGNLAFDEFVKLRQSSDGYFQVGSFIYYLHGSSDRVGREEAIHYLRKGYDLNPKNTDILNVLGTAYRQDPATYNVALKYLESNLELGGRYPDAIGSLADIYTSLNRFTEAEKILKIGMAETDTDTTYFLWDRYIRLQMLQNRWDEAKIILRQALEKYPGNYTFHQLQEEVGIRLGEKIQSSPGEKTSFNFWELPATQRNYLSIIAQIQLGHAIPMVMQYPRRPVAPLQKALQNESGIIYVENVQNFETALKTKKYEDLFIDKFGGDFGHFTIEGSDLIAGEIVRVIEENHLLDKLKSLNQAENSN